MRALSLIVLAALGCSDSGSAVREGEHPGGDDCIPRHGHVTRVLDGDTVALDVDCARDQDCVKGTCEGGRCSEETLVRLAAISAGETSGDVECLAFEAKTALEKLALDRDVELVYDPVMGCEGYYHRRLAYLWIGDTLAQQSLLQDGLVCVWWYRDEPRREDTLYHDRLVAFESFARDAGRGIWSPGAACNGHLVSPHCE